MKLCYELTKYPNIFQDIYWGNFEAKRNPGVSSKEIIENRNHFVEEYMIYRKANRNNRLNCLRNAIFHMMNGDYQSRLIDHCEIYETCFDEYIWIISPYNGAVESNLQQYETMKEDLGLEVYKPLYCKDATTLLKYFSNTSDMSTWCIERGYA